MCTRRDDVYSLPLCVVYITCYVCTLLSYCCLSQKLLLGLLTNVAFSGLVAFRNNMRCSSTFHDSVAKINLYCYYETRNRFSWRLLCYINIFVLLFNWLLFNWLLLLLSQIATSTLLVILVVVIVVVFAENGENVSVDGSGDWVWDRCTIVGSLHPVPRFYTDWLYW